MENELETLIKMRNDGELYANESKKRLEEKLEKMMSSIMVGALSAMELEMGFLWGHEEDELTEVQLEIQKMFEKARTRIFDKGNQEIKRMKAELSGYSVGMKQGGITLPVMRRED